MHTVITITHRKVERVEMWMVLVVILQKARVVMYSGVAGLGLTAMMVLIASMTGNQLFLKIAGLFIMVTPFLLQVWAMVTGLRQVVMDPQHSINYQFLFLRILYDFAWLCGIKPVDFIPIIILQEATGIIIRHTKMLPIII